MARQQQKKLAKKYVSKPDDFPNHKYWEIEKLARSMADSGHSMQDIQQTLMAYIEDEKEKCLASPVYFANTYGFIIGHGSAGVIEFEAADYQTQLLDTVRSNKHTITVKSRQLGCSTIMVFYALWFSLFSTGKRTLVVAHNREAAQEFITKVKTAYEYLPEWLKPACNLYAKDVVEFETKSRIKAITSSPNAARSFSATLFILDEAAFIEDAHSVVKGLLPTIAASDGKLIAISSPNGNSETNWFYNTFIEARTGTNGWAWHELPWTVSPIFTKNPRFREDQIRIDNGNVDKFNQEYECFPPNACVATPYGLVEISKLAVGDLVISHSGRIRSVMSTMNRTYSGNMVEIYSIGTHEPIVCTPEHPIQIYIKATQTYIWKPAKDITVDDWVVFPKLNTKDVIPIISKNMARLMAWYTTEGSCGVGYTKFSLSHEDSEMNHVVDIIKSLDLVYSVIHGTTGWSVQISNSKLSDFFKTSCGHGAKNKKIPFELIAGYEDIYFDELILGDGSYKDGLYQYDTVSKTLAYQIQLLAHSIPNRSYLATIRLTPARIAIIEGRTVECADAYHLRITNADTRNREIKLHRTKWSVAMKVKSVSTIPYSGQVYNLSVIYDESYIVAGRAVHNCSFEVNLASLFSKEALRAFIPDGKIINRYYGGMTYEDTFWIWEVAKDHRQYVIGVDCSANKPSSKDFTAFVVIDYETQEQVAEYMGKLPTELFADILLKAAKHYNNALLVIEENSYSEILFYLLENKGYSNMWYQEGKSRPGFNTNRTSRVLLIEKLVLFYNNPLGMSGLKSSRLKIQCENFSAKTIYADGSRKYESAKGNDDLCFIEGTLVTTDRGVIPIEDIKIGDLVLTHKGRYREVTKVGNRYVDTLFKVKATGKPTVVCSENHPFYSFTKYIDSRRGNTSQYKDPAWVKVNDLVVKSSGLCSVVNTVIKPIETIDLLEFAPSSARDINGILEYWMTRKTGECKNPKGASIKRFLPVSKETCFVLGYFLAEGSCGSHSVSFASHSREILFRDMVSEWAKSLNIDKVYTCQSGENGSSLTFNNKILRNFFKQFKASNKKALPDWVMWLPIELQKCVLIGYALGDGSFSSGQFGCVTISPKAVYQLYELFLRCGYLVSLENATKGKETVISGKLFKIKPFNAIRCGTPATNMLKADIEAYFPGILANKLVTDTVSTTNQTNLKRIDNFVIGGLRSLDRFDVDGTLVYNLSVDEDNSYVANSYVVHNCLALSLALIPLTPKEQMHRPISDLNIAVDAKTVSNTSDYPDEYIEHYSKLMKISPTSLRSRLKLYHDIKQGKYDGSGIDDIELKHPIEEFEKTNAVSKFLGTDLVTISSDEDFMNITKSRAILPTRNSYVIDDIFSDSFIEIQRAHRNFLGGNRNGFWQF